MSTDAYLVVHRGVVVHKFGKITQPMNLASVRKSVLGVLSTASASNATRST